MNPVKDPERNQEGENDRNDKEASRGAFRFPTGHVRRRFIPYVWKLFCLVHF
jgi:hypothetical protein